MGIGVGLCGKGGLGLYPESSALVRSELRRTGGALHVKVGCESVLYLGAGCWLVGRRRS